MEKVSETLPFSKDKPILMLVAINGFLTLITVILTFVKLRTNDFKVPVQYVVNDGSVLQTSNWYSLYSLVLFSVVGVVVTVLLAKRLHKGNRLFSVGILLAYSVVGVVSLLSTYALLGLVDRV